MTVQTVTAGMNKAEATAVDIAELARQLVEAGEKRVREDIAQRIVATLKEAQEPAPPPAPELPPLEEIAHREHNGMYDIVALLRAAESRIDEIGGLERFKVEGDFAHDTLRLLQIARERVQAMQEAFDPYI